MDGGQRPDDGVGEEGEVYLCPICNTRVDSTQSECPGCGAIFVDDDGSVPPDVSPSDAAAAEGVDIPLEYRCPACGGSVREEDETCPHCGALFVEEGEEDVAPSEPEAEPEPEPEPGPARAPPARAPAAARRAKPQPRVKEAPPEPSRRGGLSGLRLPTSTAGRTATAAAQSRQRARHSAAVKRLAARRRLIAKRRMLGMALLAVGFMIYVGAFSMANEGLTMGYIFLLVAATGLIVIGMLIFYNQYQAEKHFQTQLQTARVEAALLRERSEAPRAQPKAERETEPPKAQRVAVQPERVAVEPGVREKPKRVVVSGAAVRRTSTRSPSRRRSPSASPWSPRSRRRSTRSPAPTATT
jgi:hypothetical protein